MQFVQQEVDGTMRASNKAMKEQDAALKLVASSDPKCIVIDEHGQVIDDDFWASSRMLGRILKRSLAETSRLSGLLREECLEDADAEYAWDGTFEYAEYLKSRAWQRRRAAAIRRAGRRCQVCNSPRKLQVHHRTYERIGAEWLSDLTVLCAACHERFHDITSATPIHD